MVNSSRLRLTKLACMVGMFTALAPLRASALDVNEVFQKWQSKSPALRTADDDELHTRCGFVALMWSKEPYRTNHRAANISASGHFDEAINEYTKLLQRYPNESEFLKARAFAYEKVGKLESALADLRNAKPHPGDHQLLEVLFKLGRYQDAIAEIDRSFKESLDSILGTLANSSNDPDLLYLKGCAEAELGIPEQAAADYRQAAIDYMLYGEPGGARYCVDKNAALKNLSSSEKFDLEDLEFEHGRQSRERVSRLLEFFSKSDNPLDDQKLYELTNAPMEPPKTPSDFPGVDYRLKDVAFANSARFRTCVPIRAVCLRESDATAILGKPRAIFDDELNARLQNLEWSVPKGKLILTFFKSGARGLIYIEFRGVVYGPPAPLPNTVEELHRASTQALAANNYDAAIGFLNQLIQKQPDFAAAYEQRFTAYLGKRDYPRALESINKYLELKPGEMFFEGVRRAEVYGKLGLNNKAIADYSFDLNSKKATEYPEIAAYLYPRRGDLYWKNKEYTKALADYDECNKLFPSGEMFEHKALVEYEVGDAKAAQEDMKKSIDLFYSEARIVRRDAAMRELARMKEGEPSAAIHPSNET